MAQTNNMQTSGGDLLSKTIGFLRFPLIVGVVVIHSQVSDIVINGVQTVNGNYPLLDNLQYLAAKIFAAIAVPLFFVISGFLFFRNMRQFTAATYFAKLKKRVRTLLVPYIFWNLFVILLYFLLQTFLPGLASGRNKLIADYTLSDWIAAFWARNNGDGWTTTSPMCYQFWFIRDLMMMVLLSPAIWLAVKKLRLWVVAGLGAAWVLYSGETVPGFSLTAIFFFTAGAYLGVNNIDFAIRIKDRWRQLLVPYLIMSAVVLCFRGHSWCESLGRANIMLGMAAAVAATAHFVANGRWRPSEFLTNGSFFIYAYHAMFLALFMKLAIKVVHPHSDMALIAIFVVSPVVIISAGLVACRLLRRFMPRFTAFITGGR